MKIVMILVILVTIMFYPKAYFVFKEKEGLVLDCECYGVGQGDTIQQRGFNPLTKRVCYGMPIKCETRKMSWIEYIKSDWLLASVIGLELVLMTAYFIADKGAHKEGLVN